MNIFIKSMLPILTILTIAISPLRGMQQNAVELFSDNSEIAVAIANEFYIPIAKQLANPNQNNNDTIFSKISDILTAELNKDKYTKLVAENNNQAVILPKEDNFPNVIAKGMCHKAVLIHLALRMIAAIKARAQITDATRTYFSDKANCETFFNEYIEPAAKNTNLYKNEIITKIVKGLTDILFDNCSAIKESKQPQPIIFDDTKINNQPQIIIDEQSQKVLAAECTMTKTNYILYTWGTIIAALPGALIAAGLHEHLKYCTNDCADSNEIQKALTTAAVATVVLEGCVYSVIPSLWKKMRGLCKK
jgi:hypothetical protein